MFSIRHVRKEQGICGESYSLSLDLPEDLRLMRVVDVHAGSIMERGGSICGIRFSLGN